VVRDCGRSADELCGETYGGGHYYEVEGPRRAWVRQNYLLAAQHPDWPWDLNYCLEPIAWSQAWDHYRTQGGDEAERQSMPSPHPPAARRNGKSSENPRKAATDAPVAGQREPSSPANSEVDEYGMRVADPDDLLPDFDRLFDIRE